MNKLTLNIINIVPKSAKEQFEGHNGNGLRRTRTEYGE